MKIVPGPEMMDERRRFGTGCIAECQEGRIMSIDDDCAFQPACCGWKLFKTGNAAFPELFAIGDFHYFSGNFTAQTLARWFADLRGLRKLYSAALSGVEYGARKGVLRI